MVVEGNGGPDEAAPPRTVPIVLPESEEWPPLPATDVAPRETRVLPLSAKSPRALQQLSQLYLAWLEEQGEAAPLADMAWTAGVGRSHFAHRAGLAFHDVTSLRDALGVLAERPVEDERRWDPDPGTPPKVALVFAGEASARDGWSGGLYDEEPVVRAILDRCDAALREDRDGASLLDVMFGREPAHGTFRDPEWAQPAAYAMGCALAALWASVGLRPGAVTGHGVGELAAGWAAGLFRLDDGLRLAAARGTALARPRQRMAAAVTGEEAGGSAGDPMDDLEAAAEGIELSPPSVALVSQVTGQRMDPARPPDKTYWREQALTQEDPGRTVRALAGLDVDLVVEVGGVSPVGPTALRDWPGRVERDDQPFAKAVAQAYEAGLPVAFAGLFAGETRRRIALPGYPFQRRRHWI